MTSHEIHLVILEMSHVVEHILIMYTFHRLHASKKGPVPKHYMMVIYILAIQSPGHSTPWEHIEASGQHYEELHNLYSLTIITGMIKS
jgi:hypothetical protein